MKLYFIIYEMWVPREISPLLQEVAKKRPALLLSGARQTGKSSLLRRLFPDYPYVSLDIPLEARQASENGAAFLESKGSPLILDEVQYAPEIFRFIKQEIDQKRQVRGQFLMTGSQKFSLMKGVSESLAGRIALLNLHSLSIRELENYFKEGINSQKILNYLVRGTYPEIYEKDLDAYQFYGDYFATYVERDLRQLIQIKDIRSFDQFVRLLAIRSGQSLNLSRLASEVGVSSHTIKSWLSVLEASNIIYLLKPYYENFGKRITKSPKVYFLDSGLVCYLSNINEVKSLENSPLLGAYFETLVLGQLIRDAHNKGKAEELYYYRDREGNEVDFIQPHAGKVRLIECKWNDLSGRLPKNMKKLKEIIGEEKVESMTLITNCEKKVALSNNFFVSNILEL